MTGRPDVVTFDCYGTLIDWDAGISAAFAEAAAAAGAPFDRERVLAAYAQIEPQTESGPFRPYRDVLAETARRVARRCGWTPVDRQAGFLAASLPRWPPFPDTRRALRRLSAAGVRLGILSNVDDDLLAETIRLLGVDFDPIVTAGAVRSYKPDHGHFRRAGELLDGLRWIHAAQSWFHDIEPACALGITTVWINRAGERGAGNARPEREFDDLAAFADWLLG